MTEKEITISSEMMDAMVESVVKTWAAESPYRIREAIVKAIKDKIQASPLVEEISSMVVGKLEGHKDEIAEAAVKAVVDGVSSSLGEVYKKVAREAATQAEKAFRGY